MGNDYRHGVGDNFKAANSFHSKMTTELMAADRPKFDKARSEFLEIPVEEIKPRSINRYSQGRIEQLAQSIKHTNNRLIHPITVVRASDLKDDNEVIVKFKEKGIDKKDLKYIIVSGERRYRAWLKLSEEAKEENADALGWKNPFATITANVLTDYEAISEKAFFEDSNLEVRQLTPMEALLHIQDALKAAEGVETKREILKEMSETVKETDSNGNEKYWFEQAVPKSDSDVENTFNQATYAAFYINNQIGIPAKESLMKKHLAIINKCDERIVDAIVNGEIPENEALNLKVIDNKERQVELLELYKTDREKYREALIENGAIKKKTSKVRSTYVDTKRAVSTISKYLDKQRIALIAISKNQSPYDRENTQDVINKIQETMLFLEEKKGALKGENK